MITGGCTGWTLGERGRGGGGRRGGAGGGGGGGLGTVCVRV